MKTLLFAGATVAALTTANLAPAIAQATQPVSQVVQWNRMLLVIVRTPGAQPATIHATRSFAIMHAAIYDAVNAIEETHKPYLVRLSAPHFASEEAAAAAAAHEVLVKLYPSFQPLLDTQFQQVLAQLPTTGRADGVSIGQKVADSILDRRENDGSNAQPIPYVFGKDPGDYQSTPPNFPKQPQFTHWSRVKPFALDEADQFRPSGPPALTTDRLRRCFRPGQIPGDRQQHDRYRGRGADRPFLERAIQNYWNEIAQTASLAHNLTTAENARLFALLNLSFADSVIAFYDAKYTYNFWRPVTAIRAAATDGNPETEADPNWLPEVTNTAPDPSYPGAHAVISAAGAEVLTSFFRKDDFAFDVTSEVLPGVTRSFMSFPAAAEEATLSRVFAGQHFLFDLTTGQRLGDDVADFCR